MITAGGTGGHIFPGIAVAERLRELGWRVVWLGSRGGMEESVVAKHGIDIDLHGFRGLRGKGLQHTLFGGFYLLLAFVQSARAILQRRPDVVLGTGGYPSFPGGMMAAFLGRPLLIHDSNALAGLANRILAHVADRILVAFPNAFGARRTLVTGTPVRLAIAQLPPPEQRMVNRQGPLTVLVVGGSLGAQALNQIVPQTIALLEPGERPHVIHQAGAKHLEGLQQAYQAHNVTAQCRAFIDDMASAYAQCDLIICRSGAQTIAEITAAGVASILVPLPSAIADEQTHNARYLSERGAAWLIPQSELTAEKLAQRLRELNRDKLMAIAQAAWRLGQRDATQKVADACVELSEDGTRR